MEIEEAYKKITTEADKENKNYWVKTGNNLDQLNATLAVMAQKIYSLENKLEKMKELTKES